MGISTAIAGLELTQNGKRGNKGPIRFNGVPGSLEGNIQLKNTTESKLTLNSMPLEAPKLQDEAFQPLSEVRIAARLYPGQQDNVHIEFSVAANTPPGTYEAVLQVGNHTQAAQIQINPFIEITLTPDEITLYTEGKNRFEIEFEVTNNGNIPVNMGDMLSAPLQTESGLEAQMQKALLELCDDLDSLDSDKQSSLLNKLLCSLSKQQAGKITMNWDNSPLDPGETLTFKSTIELPDDLPLNRHYLAEVEILSESLEVDIYTYGA